MNKEIVCAYCKKIVIRGSDKKWKVDSFFSCRKDKEKYNSPLLKKFLCKQAKSKKALNFLREREKNIYKIVQIKIHPSSTYIAPWGYIICESCVGCLNLKCHICNEKLELITPSYWKQLEKDVNNKKSLLKRIANNI